MNVLKPHVSLNISNIDASVAFYEKLFGVTATKRRPGYAKFDLSEPSLNLALNEVPNLTGPGALSHLGIQVSSTDDVLTIRKQWAEAGLITRDEMKTDCCYATQDKTWVRDPDGNEWEAFVVLVDNLPESAKASSCCTTDAACATA